MNWMARGKCCGGGIIRIYGSYTIWALGPVMPASSLVATRVARWRRRTGGQSSLLRQLDMKVMSTSLLHKLTREAPPLPLRSFVVCLACSRHLCSYWTGICRRLL